MEPGKDYYKVLGVAKNASKDEIKKAFHKLAHKYHPDKKTGDAAQFKEIGEAYSVLSDDRKRAEYDAYGRVFQGGQGGPQQGGFQGFDMGGFDFSQFQGANGFGDMAFDLGDLFGDLFQGGGRNRVRRGRDISIDIEISFRDSVFGTTRKVLISKIAACQTCTGTGAARGSATITCQTCGGSGKLHEAKNSFFGTFSTVKMCDRCFGVGTVPEKPCQTCRGGRVMKREEEISVTIPAGVSGGEMIRLTGAGEAVPNGVPGDLYVKIHTKDDPKFRKEGKNLVTTLSVKLTDALLGSEYSLTSVDGQIAVEIPAGVKFGEYIRIKGKGIPIEGTRRGDLLVKIEITMPAKLSKKAREAIEHLREEGI
jgi:molecular chaperone DnaJ